MDSELTKQRLKAIVADLKQTVDSVPSVTVTGTAIGASNATVALSIDTTSFTAGHGGLPVEPSERVELHISPLFPHVIPTVWVKHDRWLGYPHVLQGRRLCLILDPAHWNPLGGANGFLSLLWDWFDDAIAGRFDAATSLYHPVGGVLHQTAGAPTLVVNQPLRSPTNGGVHFQTIALTQRSTTRYDLASWNGADSLSDTHQGLLVVLDEMLPAGAGRHLSSLASHVATQRTNGARKRLFKDLDRIAKKLPPSTPLQIILAVPNPALDGDTRYHLLALQIATDDIAVTLNTARTHKPPDDEPAITWLYVDDQRSGIAQRRDSQRPSHFYLNKAVEIWGCGALGSWLAETLARSGISTITLRDPGRVTRGLLVRQNYTEADIGQHKVLALKKRLESVSDVLEVRAETTMAQASDLDDSPSDFIIDTTVSTGTAVFIDNAQTSGRLTTPVVQLSTDVHTSTLGILTIRQPDITPTTSDIDVALHDHVKANAGLNPFLTFWDMRTRPPLTPALGCSVPTFNGSNADAQAIAATAASLMAAPLRRGVSGGYLFATPHSPHAVPPVNALHVG